MSGAGSETSEGDSIKVFVRVRPPDTSESDISHGRVVEVDSSRNAIIMQSRPDPKIFTYDYVADTDTAQETVFSLVGKKLIDSCVNGYNGTIFAYGQTGSGKTFTMLGPSEDDDNFQHELRGVVPRSFEYLFSLISREKDMHGDRKEFLTRCSFLEIYNEQIYDLLDSSSPSLSLRENIKKGVYVDGVIEQAVNNPSEAYQVLNNGWINRRVASTSMNRESSRSHAVFTVHIESKETKAGVSNVRMSQLHLVDLAGSERQKDTNASGVRLKEAGSINRSLSILGNVIMSLGDIAHGKTRHVPYRDSRLTFLLRDSLGGNSKTSIIACVHPGSKSFGETLSTLQFAKRAKMIKNKAVVNEDTQGNIMHLQAEIRRLKELLQQSQTTIKEIPVTGMTGSDPSTDVVDSQWKFKFLQAMELCAKAENDKQNLKETIAKLQEQCVKGERFLQTTKMIVKFRDNQISRLKSMAKKEEFDTKESIIEDLKAEITILNEKVEQHPEVSKCSMKIQQLKAELRKLQAQPVTQQNIMADSQRVEQLQKLYSDLSAVKNTDDEKPFSTPQTGENNVATATLNKYRSQVENLEAELDKSRQSLTEQKEMSEKKQVELESEIESLKKTVSELDSLIAAHQLKSKIEKRTMNDNHMSALEKLSTPKRRQYELRSRASESFNTSPKVLFTDTEESTEGGIFEETLPHEVVESVNETLTDEIKQLQIKNNELDQKNQSMEAEMIKLNQAKIKLDHYNQHLSEKISKERAEWVANGEKLNAEITSLKKDLAEHSLSSDVYKGEARDLNILLQSADKELKEHKTKFKVTVESKAKECGMLETKLLQVTNQLSDRVKEYETLYEEKNELQENLETASATLAFTEDMLQEAEDQKKEELEKSRSLQKELDKTLQNLLHEKEQVENLRHRMTIEGKEQAQQMVSLSDELKSLHSANALLQNQCDAHNDTEALLRKELEKYKTDIIAKEKELAEEKEAVNTIMKKVREIKSELTEKEQINNSLRSQVEEQIQQNKFLDSISENQSMQLRELQQQIDDLLQNIENQKCQYEVEVSVLQDELERAMEVSENMQKDCEVLIDKLQVEGNSLRHQLDVQNIKMEEQEKHHMEKLAILENKSTDYDELTGLLRIREEEISGLRGEITKVIEINEDFSNKILEKNTELQTMKNVLSEAEEWREKFQKSEVQLLVKTRAITDMESALHEHKMEMCKQLEESKTLEVDVRKSKDEIENLEKLLSEEKVTKMSFETFNKQLTEDLERLKEVLKRDHSQLEELKSMVTELKEEKTKDQKITNELSARNQKLVEENAKLIGHQNLKQKIQYHVQLKEENNHLKAEVAKLKREIETASRKSSNTPGKERAIAVRTILKEHNQAHAEEPMKTGIVKDTCEEVQKENVSETSTGDCA